MNNLVLFSDSKENIKYNLTVEGCNIENTSTKLCLEFNDGYNLYFNGKIDNQGNCVVTVDALKEFDGNGKAKIEVIAENTYFVLHEMPFEVKKKVNVKINENVQKDFIEIEDDKPKVGISFQQDKVEELIEEKKEKPKKEEPKKEETKREEKGNFNGIKKFSDF